MISIDIGGALERGACTARSCIRGGDEPIIFDVSLRVSSNTVYNETSWPPLS